ncbi:hypothetical protein [Jannaschia aquimarina]|uniref:Uncharacterized protein n=1 Tax=Jannaschia aquimarina TaxID=935700 RepID=A0A0D1EK14_9RHOB|nr:hypothetical protein [Jannaschia aquimarina]KIT16160.1 hypothetical protein jaqu_21220 [Jannaschia aquimarina]SNT36955.1 hypothetical protein SAMN05421775_11321 [Jannaschia aquimarina]
MALSEIRAEDEIFVREGERGVGAVRVVHPDHLLVMFEGYGEMRLEPKHIKSAHDGKVIVDVDTLPEDLRSRLPHIHDGESRG